MIDHLIVAPVVLPLLAGAVMLLRGRQEHRNLNAAINVVSALTLVGVSTTLVAAADAAPTGVLGAYHLGNWPAPFAIVLIVDRLSALMILLTSLIGAAAVVFSIGRWHRAGPFFHPLFQFLLMGLNGAFLTGDLFSLFVFFELLLAASYGLALHGSGSRRVKAGLHYIVVNLVASLMFLIGVSLIYGVTGTLNMADLATRIPKVALEDRALLEAGTGILGIAFLVKCGIWPLCFWLPATYAAVTPPIACVFAVLTKVGAYIVLRLWLLLFGVGAAQSAHYGGEWLLVGGIATVAFGAIGILACQDTARLAAYFVIVSSGTVITAVGLGEPRVTAGALFYLISSTLAIAALFLLVDLIDRGRELGADMLAVTREAFGEEDDREDDAVALPIPIAMGILGIGFLACGLVVVGLPPLSGFIGKFAILTAALNPSSGTQGGTISPASWALLVALIASGLASLIAITRAGIHAFWTPSERAVPQVSVIEMTPIIVLLLLSVLQTFQAGPVMRYMLATGHSVHDPQAYIRGVLGAGTTGER